MTLERSTDCRHARCRRTTAERSELVSAFFANRKRFRVVGRFRVWNSRHVSKHDSFDNFFESVLPQLSRKKRAFFDDTNPHTSVATPRPHAKRWSPVYRASLAAGRGHRTAPERSSAGRDGRGAWCFSRILSAIRDTRGRTARARHVPHVAFPLCYAPAMAVFAARESRSRPISLGIAESDADPTSRLPPRPQLDARLPPELRWIAALCSSSYFQPCERHEPAGGKEKEKGELTNFFARDTGETLCPSCVGGRDVVQVRLGFRRDFAGGHLESSSAKASTPSRARIPARPRADARSASPMDVGVFSQRSRKFARFRFFASANALAFRVLPRAR